MRVHIGDWAILEQAASWGVVLDAHMRNQLTRYLTQLYEANQRFNLTRVPPEQAVGRHLVDSLCLLAVESFSEGAHVLDIGSGAGLPGIPLSIARPDLRVTLLDSHGKAVQFLQGVCAELKLNATPLLARAEEWAHTPEAREHFDVVVARAVAKMPILTELMTPFLKVGGIALALKSVHETDEILLAASAAQLVGATLTLRTVRFETEQGAVTRAIAKLHKERPTPDQYPRAWKRILSRPLGDKP
jgi:16S rRNA (guanine527-N7)-methyltransferase